VCDNSIYAREAFFIYINSEQHLTRELRAIRRTDIGHQRWSLKCWSKSAKFRSIVGANHGNFHLGQSQKLAADVFRHKKSVPKNGVSARWFFAIPIKQLSLWDDQQICVAEQLLQPHVFNLML
jgi:hypothetical protein